MYESHRRPVATIRTAASYGRSPRKEPEPEEINMRSQKPIYGILAVSLFVLMIVFEKPALPAQTAPVQVMNTAGPAPGQNVPISGNVGITGTPTVNIGNSPTVGLLAGAAVRDADNPARHAWQTRQAFSVTGDFECDAFSVPSGKELVIENFSAFGWVPAGQQILHFDLITSIGGIEVQHFFRSDRSGTQLGYEIFVAGQQTRLYSEPGSLVRFCLSRDSGVDEASMTVALSGHLVDLP
jgi:hypothetical protein